MGGGRLGKGLCVWTNPRSRDPLVLLFQLRSPGCTISHSSVRPKWRQALALITVRACPHSKSSTTGTRDLPTCQSPTPFSCLSLAQSRRGSSLPKPPYTEETNQPGTGACVLPNPRQRGLLTTPFTAATKADLPFCETKEIQLPCYLRVFVFLLSSALNHKIVLGKRRGRTQMLAWWLMRPPHALPGNTSKQLGNHFRNSSVGHRIAHWARDESLRIRNDHLGFSVNLSCILWR